MTRDCNGRTFVVGDVHGCYYTLLDLLDATLRFDLTKDLLYCTGDLVDRGKFSLEVLSLFMNNTEAFMSVRGNHDHKFLRWLKGMPVTLSERDGNCGSHYNLDREQEEAVLLREFLESLPLALHINDEATVVHAGLPPELDHRVVPERFSHVLDILMYIRHWREGAEVKARGREKVFFDSSLPFWHDFYAARPYGGIVFFGHDANRDGPIVRDGLTRIIGLDTGAALGGSLTAYSIDDERFYSVCLRSEDLF